MSVKGAGGFSVGIGQRDKIVSLVNFGGLEPNTRYPIASASKFLTAATVMVLVDEGTLSLDRPVSHWLPSFPVVADELTLRHLLSQTSGLAGPQGEFYEFAQDHRMTLAQSALEVMQRPLISRPGNVFAYGGPGFQVVGAVVEAATGKRWSDIFQEKLAGPLGMTRTRWTHPYMDRANDAPIEEILNPVLQGGAVSTAEDYLNFLSMIAKNGMFAGKRVLSRDSVDEMLADQTSGAEMTSTGSNILVDAHYALGNWCESWDEEGNGVRNSSLGFFGMYPWVERSTGRFGIIFPFIREDAFRFWPDIAAIRDAVSGS
ncbi:serine hydrolase domain-containing protein [Salmonella enterica]